VESGEGIEIWYTADGLGAAHLLVESGEGIEMSYRRYRLAAFPR